MADKCFKRNFKNLMNRIVNLKREIIPMMNKNPENKARTFIENTFSAMGWNYENHSISQEDHNKDGFLDYINRIPRIGAQNELKENEALKGYENVICLEAKSLKENVHAEKWYQQAMNYNKTYNAPLVVVTNGKDFSIYNDYIKLPDNLDNRTNRRIVTLDIAKDSRRDCLAILYGLSPNKMASFLGGQFGDANNSDFAVYWRTKKVSESVIASIFSKFTDSEAIQNEISRYENKWKVNNSGVSVPDIQACFTIDSFTPNVFCEDEFTLMLNPENKYVISVFGETITANNNLQTIFVKFVERLIALGYITKNHLPIDSSAGRKSILNTTPTHPNGDSFTNHSKLCENIYLELGYGNSSTKDAENTEKQMYKIMEALRLDFNYVDILRWGEENLNLAEWLKENDE
jgi:hypothetical protein